MKFKVKEIIDTNGVHTNKFELFELKNTGIEKKMGIIHHKSNADRIIKLLNRRWGNSQ